MKQELLENIEYLVNLYPGYPWAVHDRKRVLDLKTHFLDMEKEIENLEEILDTL